MAGASGFVVRQRVAPVTAHLLRPLLIDGEQAGDDGAGGFGGVDLALVMVEGAVHEAFEIAFGIGHCRGETGEHPPCPAHIGERFDAGCGGRVTRRGDHIIDHQADLTADQFAQDALLGDIGQSGLYAPEIGSDERLLAQLIDGQDIGAQAIVDVVIVIGNIVGHRRDLCLQRGKARQIEREGAVDFAHRPGWITHRAIMFGESFERLPGQVEPVEMRIGGFEAGQRP